MCISLGCFAGDYVFIFLKEVETFKFMENAFREGAIKTVGTDIDKILPPMSLFGGRAKKKAIVLEKLNNYFDKYEGLL